MSPWDPHYEALMSAKADVRTAVLFVDAATTARPFDMNLLNKRMDELSAAHQKLVQTQHDQENP